MSKDEALIELQRGNKVTHKYLKLGEFIFKRGKNYVFKDGYIATPILFWKDKGVDEWENNWELFKD